MEREVTRREGRGERPKWIRERKDGWTDVREERERDYGCKLLY